MESRAERQARLRQASKQSANAADALLDSELQVLMQATQVDLAALRPQVQDKVAFDQLVAAVTESTQANESLAQLKVRIAALGAAAVSVTKTASKILRG